MLNDAEVSDPGMCSITRGRSPRYDARMDSGKDPIKATQQPMQILWFLLPFLLFYQFGLIWLAANNVSSDAALWAESFLHRLIQLLAAIAGYKSLAPHFLPAALMGMVLLSMHLMHLKKQRDLPWLPRPHVQGMMLAESMVAALPLLVLSLMAARWHTHGTQHGTQMAIGALSPDHWQRLIMGTGAGLFEEFLFRLFLFVVLDFVLHIALRVHDTHNPKKSVREVVCVLASALIFAMAHFNSDNPFSTTLLLFYTIAGIWLGVLYLSRGLGIAAGTHVIYNLVIVFLH